MNTSKYRILVGAYCILIILVSTIPGSSLVNIKLSGWDKLFHFLEYSILGWLLIHSLERGHLRIVLVVLTGGIIFGAFDETWQQLISNRSASIYDWFTDTIGVIVGGTVALFVENRRSSASSNSNIEVE